MGGLVFSTILTLFFIPVVYEVLDRKVIVAEDAVPAFDGVEPPLDDVWQASPREQQQRP
jgi:hypothetical protein